MPQALKHANHAISGVRTAVNTTNYENYTSGTAYPHGDIGNTGTAPPAACFSLPLPLLDRRLFLHLFSRSSSFFLSLSLSFFFPSHLPSYPHIFFVLLGRGG